MRTIREKSKYAPVWYLLFIIAGAWAGLLIGVATDEAVDENNRLDITMMEMPDITSVETYKKLSDDESNARVGALIGGFVVVLIILQITSNRKRFHRRGEEHGSARWGTLAEKRKLADKGMKVGTKGKRDILKPYIFVELEDMS